MIVEMCRKAVVNYSKPVLFPQGMQRLQHQIKLSFCCGWVGCFVEGQEERVELQREN
jgi:hypothetical protein